MPQTFHVGSRSFLVDAVAWLLIAAAGLGGSWAVAAVLGMAAAWPAWALQFNGLPWLTSWIAAHLVWVVLGTMALAAATAACAVGLLLRLEWARRSGIGLLALVIAAHLAGLWLQHEFVAMVVRGTLQAAPLPAAVAGVFGGVATAAQVMAVLVTLAGCALVAWAIGGLMSQRVRQEFA